MSLTLICSFILSVILGSRTIKILKTRKIKQLERIDGPESHFKKAGTPTMGGIFVILTSLIMVILTIIGMTQINNNIYLISLAIITILFGMIGFIDDYIKVEKQNTDGLVPRKKMLALAIVSVIYILLDIFVFKTKSELLIPFFGNLAINKYIFLALSILTILSTTNAINLTDGIDGLASSVGILLLMFFGIIGIQIGNVEVMNYSIILIGAFLGFLLYNWSKAKVFMGDVGSFFLGASIAILANLTGTHFFLLIVALVPIFETISVIIQVLYYKKTKKRFFKMAPFHHHLEKCGWNEVKIVMVFTVITLLLVALALIGVRL